MSGILAELHDNSIITSDAVMRLKSYIAGKSPDVSAARRAVILADAMNKVIDSRLPKFEEMMYKKMKRLLLEHTANKPSFDITCSDVFQAAIELMESGNLFFDELDVWLSSNLGRKLPREQLIEVVLKSHELMVPEPEMGISDLITAAETAIDARADLLKQTLEAEAVLSGLETTVSGPEAGLSGPEVGSGANEALESQAVPGYFLDVFGQRKSDRSFGLKNIIRDWKKSSVLAAAAIILTVVLLFGIGRILDRTAYESKYLEAAGNVPDLAYAVTVLTEEDVAASPNAAENSQSMRMMATAYDLSLESCGKLPDEPGYGITSSGSKAEAGRTVAVDPKVIPLGSRLKITFPEEYCHLDGIYIAEDTGRMIKGSSIDIFFGEDNKGSSDINDKAMKFGVRSVEVTILDNTEKGSS